MDRDLGESRRGSVLLISVCILALMSLFALTFARLVNYERAASVNYIDAVRARMLSRAGIARAVVEMQEVAGQRHYSDPSQDDWKYELTRPGSMTQIQQDALDLKLDLLITASPSFLISNLELLKANAADPAPRMFQAPLAVSGLMGRSYDGGLDVYKLKVVDCASQLNLNHPDPATITRMLKNLLRATAEEDPSGWSLTDAQAQTIATNVISKRPRSGFTSKSEVKALLVTGSITDKRWINLLRDKLTIFSWVDDKVIRPWNLNEDPMRQLPIMPRAPINLNTATKPVLVALFTGLEARNDYGTFKIGYVNAKDIADRIIRWRTVENDSTPYAGVQSGSETEVAAGLTLRKGPFRSWTDFEAFVDHRLFIDGYANVEVNPPADPANPPAYISVPAGVTVDQNYQAAKALDFWPEGLVPNTDYEDMSPTWRALRLGQGIRDMIKAQLNPNTMLNKFGQAAHHGGLRNNGLPIPRLVDKSDILRMTTEGCLDAMGVYEITSVGMVLMRDPQSAEFYANFLGTARRDGEMTIVASQTQQVVIRVYDVVRYTTQADFEKYRAFMLPGDFIPDVQYWKGDDIRPAGVLGVNRADDKIMSTALLDDAFDTSGTPAGEPSWPGLISHPTYSMVRKGDAAREISDDYVPARYDGSLTLTNLLGVDTKPADFVAGFARGSINAFKCRVWWDPKDQDPFFCQGQLGKGYPFQRNGKSPSHPLGLTPPAGVATGKDHAWWERWFAGEETVVDPTPHRNPAWPSGGVVSGSSIKVDFTNLKRLTDAKPGGDKVPSSVGKDGGEPSPLDAVSTGTPSTGAWWHEGASLWNNGVAMGPRRKSRDGTRTPVLVYDGDNIDLERASSIRFWVQPLGDPYLREEEVLLSFIGSRDGQKRDVGFRVRKEVIDNGDIWVRLEVAPSYGYGGFTLDPGNTRGECSPECGGPLRPGDPGAAGRSTAHIRHRDYLDWAVTGNPWKSRVSIDVKPKVDERFGNPTSSVTTFPQATYASNPSNPDWGGAGTGNFLKLDPLSPEWFANTWHWVVVNYGYARNDDGGASFPQFDMSLQVDMRPPQPPWGLDPVEPGRIAFAGDTTLSGANNFWGEMHGHEHAGSHYVGSTRYGEHPNGTADTRVPRSGKDPEMMEPLGIDRKCPNCPYEICGTAEGIVGIDKEHIDFTDHGRIDATHAWMEPRVLGDFYNCRVGNPARFLPVGEVGARSVRVPGPGRTLASAITYTPPVFDTDGVTILTPPAFNLNGTIQFPIDSFEPTVTARVYFGDGSTQDIALPFNFNQNTPGTWTTSSMPTYADITAKGGISRIDLELGWVQTAVKPGDYECPDCTAHESTTGAGDWDGELMHQWATNQSIFPDRLTNPNSSWQITAPNGDNHCVLGMEIHGRPKALCQVASQLPCWTVTGTELGGVAWGYNLTGAFLPPSQYYPYSAPPGGSKGVGKFPADLLCDGCRGCEGCDVDAPLFLGGEPAGADNYEADGITVKPPNTNTMAFAVFDNLVIKNRTEFEVRTDFHPSHGDVPAGWTAEVDWYEDRYFEMSTAREHFDYNSNTTNQNSPDKVGYGATYRRGLFELYGQRARLGSMTWTTYGTSTYGTSASGGLQFEVKLYNVPGMDGTGLGRKQTWRKEKPDLLTLPGSRLVSRSGTFDSAGNVTGYTAGVGFGKMPASETLYDGIGKGKTKAPETLVLAIQLGGLYSVLPSGTSGTPPEDDNAVNTRSTVSHNGTGTVTIGNTGLPTPIYESPVFEDVTINMIRETAQILYSEEGVACN